MQVEFTIPLKAFSVNAYHYRDKRHKTAEAKAWEEIVLKELYEHKELVDIAEDFRAKGKGFRVELVFKYPYNIFYNANRDISSRTFDLSNVEKPLLDLLFGKVMEINDKYVIELISRKEPAALYSIDVKIEVLESIPPFSP